MRLPGVCKACRAALFWNGSRWATPSGQAHKCRRRCGAFMPIPRDRCGRKPGHAGYHRSQYAMANERFAKTGRAA